MPSDGRVTKRLAPALLPLLIVACAAPGPSVSPTAVAPPLASPSEAPSASVHPSSTASASVEASPSSGAFAVGDWVETTADLLNLRERAGIEAEAKGRLPVGSAGTIAAGPVEADGYSWYAVAAPGIPAGSGCIVEEDPTILSCPAWFGWLAAGDLDGNPWLVPAEPQCPDVSTIAFDIARGPAGLMYACFRGQTLTIDAYVGEVPITDCYVPYTVTPAWLFFCNRAYLQADAAPPETSFSWLANVDPSLGTCTLGGRNPECPFAVLEGQYIEVDGHFEDPAAAACEADGDPAIVTDLDPAEVIYRCREGFVITAIRPGEAP